MSILSRFIDQISASSTTSISIVYLRTQTMARKGDIDLGTHARNERSAIPIERLISADFGEAEKIRRKQLHITRKFADNNGVTIVNCHKLTKRPIGKQWQKSERRNNERIEAAVRRTLNPGYLLLDDIVDIDIDDSSLLHLAEYFLPKTSTYGRQSKPSSHWAYKCTDGVPFSKIRSVRGHVEIRTGKHQSLAPGSIHPTGELYVWENSSKPTSLSEKRLNTAVRLLVAGSVIVCHWHIGQRDDLAVAVCGVLLRSGFATRVVDEFIGAICRCCRDEQVKSRLKAKRLKRSLKKGDSVPGIPALRKLLGADAKVFLDAVEAIDDAADPLNLIRADQIKPEAIQWMWPQRIALGKIMMLVGDPGASKSTVSLDIAATVTTGRSFPDGTSCGVAGDVVLITGEDDAADTIIPRFIAAGGDRSRLHLLGEDFAYHEKAERLAQAIQQLPRPKLIIFDPITEYMSAKNPGDMLEARKMLAPLVNLVRELNIACIAISHLNKDQAKSAIYRTTGSVAFVAVARSVYLVVKDPASSDRRLMLPVKNNLGPDQEGLAYSVLETNVGEIVTTKIQWECDPVSLSVDDVLVGVSAGRSSPKLEQACDWLFANLSAGPVFESLISIDAAAAGISQSTLRRAKKELDIKSTKIGELGEDGHWEWALR